MVGLLSILILLILSSCVSIRMKLSAKPLDYEWVEKSILKA